MRCANPQCQVESDYLRDGGLYAIDELIPHSKLRQSRFIWLCPRCSEDFVVETWRPAGQQLVMKMPPPEVTSVPARVPAPHVHVRRSLPPRASSFREARQRVGA
jgi:hypothetical protein